MSFLRCHNKVLQIGWPKTTEMYSVAGLETRSLMSDGRRTMLSLKPQRESSLPPPGFWWWPLSCSCIAPVSASVTSGVFPLPLSHLGFSLCGGVQIPLFLRVWQLYWTRAPLNDLVLTWWHLQRPCFQIRSHSQALGVKTSTYIFEGHNSVRNR